MALSQVVEKIYTAMSNNEFALGIFLDLSKAFDTVDHSILLSKLHRYGFQGTAFNWLSSYISNREQYVLVNGVASSKVQMLYGVPQGSILGPLLFLIYINDLANISTILLAILFADDTSIILSHENFESLMKDANAGIAKMSDWFQTNKLSLNVSKSNFIIFTGKNKNYDQSMAKLSIGLNDLKQVPYTKFLGVLIDERLSWQMHINLVNNKVRKSIGIIRKIRGLISQNALRILYFSLIYPHLSYCNIVWASTYRTNLQKLLISQKKIARIATFSDYLAPSAPLFKKLNLLTIFDINILQTCLFIFKFTFLPESLPKPFDNFFTSNSQIHSHFTRQADNLHPPFKRTTLSQFALSYRGTQLWNIHLKTAKISSSLNNFKSKLKSILIDQTTCSSNPPSPFLFPLPPLPPLSPF